METPRGTWKATCKLHKTQKEEEKKKRLMILGGFFICNYTVYFKYGYYEEIILFRFSFSWLREL